MGCDIHLYAERKEGFLIRRWKTIEKWHTYEDGFFEPVEKFYKGGRNYNLFCALAGVRSYQFHGDPPHFPIKGLPSDCCKEIKEKSDELGTDGHTHSWLTKKEIEDFDWSPYGGTVTLFLEDILPKMDSKTRIVFFFDN